MFRVARDFITWLLSVFAGSRRRNQFTIPIYYIKARDSVHTDETKLPRGTVFAAVPRASYQDDDLIAFQIGSFKSIGRRRPNVAEAHTRIFLLRESISPSFSRV